MKKGSHIKNSLLVKDFMLAFNQEVKMKPAFPDRRVLWMRVRLIWEEFRELLWAVWKRDLVGVYDSLVDLLFVVHGFGLACGLDLDAGMREVSRSNMSKLGADGKPIYRSDGKVLKGPNYSPPDLKKVLGL